MQTKIAANAQAMKRWLGKAETTLGNHSDRLNAINIFPVADGDTGTNLYLTARAAAQAVPATDAARSSGPEAAAPTAAMPVVSAVPSRHDAGTAPAQNDAGTVPSRHDAGTAPAQNDVGAVLARAGQAAMEQARGNSGTLFAVFLCAAAEPLIGHTRLSAPLLATALNRAQIRAWSALSDPVPGTMLSVMEAAARAVAAVDSAHSGDDSNHTLGLALDAAVEAALAAVVRTEDQLDALHAAHVVDAGGVGMLLILDCLRSAVLGEELQSELLDGLHGYDVQDPHIHSAMPRDEGVEVMCTISLSPLDAAMMRQRLDEMGDSVIMSQVGGAANASGQYRWRVHVHVLDAEPAVALIRSLGDPSDLSISELAVPREAEEPDPAALGPEADRSRSTARETDGHER